MTDTIPVPSYQSRSVLDGITPRWLSGVPLGRAWLLGNAVMKDAALAAAKLAVKARFPSLAPDDALPYLAAERRIERGHQYTIAQFREQIVNAWDAWSLAGTKDGLVAALRTAGFRNFMIVQNYETPMDGNPDHWWKFWIVVWPPFPWPFNPTLTWDPGLPWDPGLTWPGVPQEWVERVKQVVRLWKPAHAICANLVVHSSGLTWDPGMTWDPGIVWPDAIEYIDVES